MHTPLEQLSFPTLHVTSNTPAVTCFQALRVEMAAALAAGSADLESRERAVREAEKRVVEQQVGGGAITDGSRVEVHSAAGRAIMRCQGVAAQHV